MGCRCRRDHDRVDRWPRNFFIFRWLLPEELAYLKLAASRSRRRAGGRARQYRTTISASSIDDCGGDRYRRTRRPVSAACRLFPSVFDSSDRGRGFGVTLTERTPALFSAIQSQLSLGDSNEQNSDVLIVTGGR